ncbi:MAG: M48 family metalloprotease [Acidobacteriota bacterium]
MPETQRPRAPRLPTTASVLLLSTVCWLCVVLAPAVPAMGQAPTSGADDGVAAFDADLYEKSAKAAQAALGFYGKLDDPEETERLQTIGYRLAAHLHGSQFPFSFNLIDMPVPNAFALPGGHIFVTRGMLDLGLDDDMLANLVGHEIAHVVHEHGQKMQKRATLLNILSQAALLGVMIGADGGPANPRDPYGAAASGSRKGSLVQGAAASGIVFTELLLRNFNRGFEDEADVEGQRLAAAAGYDPDGARRLWQVMIERIPTSNDYGYWRTHPFSEQRLRAAEVRARDLTIAEPAPSDEFRQATQGTILAFAAGVEPPKPVPEETRRAGDRRSDERRPGERRPNAPLAEPAPRPEWQRDLRVFLELSALDAWPRGARADSIREARLERLRRRALDRPELERDYGALIDVYREEIETVRALTPESPLLGRLNAEIGRLRASAEEAYPRALAVWHEGVVQTPFLETFVSNYPDADVAADVALALGDAYSRRGQQGDAVSHYLKAYAAGPTSDAGLRALRGLQVLTPQLDDLVALRELATDSDDVELRRLAAARLEDRAERFDQLEIGASYLRRFPDGPHREQVEERIETLARNLYGEVVLYQGVGDHIQALERIQQILEHAPTTAAAKALRDRAVLDT